jgi:hypothetical protein
MASLLPVEEINEAMNEQGAQQAFPQHISCSAALAFLETICEATPLVNCRLYFLECLLICHGWLRRFSSTCETP